MVSALLIRDVGITIERLHDPTLYNVPLILLRGTKRLRVLTRDELARQAGVEVGITRKQAELLCPSAMLLEAREDIYRRIFAEVTRALLQDIGKIEATYQPTNALWIVNTNEPQELAVLRKTIHSTMGIPVAIGTGSSKFVARVAAATTPIPNLLRRVREGEEQAFLAPYPATLLPLNKDMKRRLPMMGIHTMGQYAALSRAAVFSQWAQDGRWCHDLAYGIDPRPLQSYQPPPVLTQTHVFDEPIEDKQVLMASCLQLAPMLIHQLNRREARRLVLLLTCDDQTIHELHLAPSVPLRDIFQLHRQLPYLLKQPTFTAGVTRLSLQLSGIADVVPTQLSLFDFAGKQHSFDKAMNEWQNRFHETLYQPTLTDAPRLFPPEWQYEYAAVGA